MPVRSFRPADAPAVSALVAASTRSEGDFVLNPMWESEAELVAEFERFGVDPADHVRVAEGAVGEPVGVSGFLREPGGTLAGLLCPVVSRAERGRGLGGELLRDCLRHGRELGIRLVSAGIGTRNRAGYALLTGQGFRPVSQHFLLRCDTAPKPGPPVHGLAFEPAGEADLEPMLRIYEACGFEPRTRESMAARMADGRHVHAVARNGDRVQAFVELETHWPNRVWVAFVGVEPRLRARGMGTALVAWALEREFEAGGRSALLVLSPANRTAYRAYEKAGFRRSRTFDVLQRTL